MHDGLECDLWIWRKIEKPSDVVNMPTAPVVATACAVLVRTSATRGVPFTAQPLRSLKAVYPALNASRHTWPLGGTLVKLMPLALGAVFIVMGIILTVAVTGCTHTQQTVGGAAAGGVAGAVVAGPIGAAVGAGAGAVTAPIIANR